MKPQCERRNFISNFLDKTIGGTVFTAPQILSLLLPLFLDQVFVRTISLLNSSMISSYGENAMNAVSMVDSVNNFIVNVFMAVSTGCTVVVAQYIGRKDQEKATLTTAQAISSAVLVALTMCCLILIFIKPMIGFLFGKGDQQFVNYCEVYFRASAISYPFFALIQTALGAMRGSGNARISVYFSVALNILNVIFNIVFLNIFQWGVMGISISVILCRVITSIAVMIYILRSKTDYPLKPRHFFKPDMKIQKSIFTIALPVSMEQLFFHGGRVLTQTYIVSFGTVSTAVNSVALQYSGFLQLIGFAFQSALVTIAGQCIGAGKLDEAKSYIKRMTIICSVLSAAFAVLLVLNMRIFMGFFNISGETLELAYKLCAINAIVTPLVWSSSFVLPQGLRAAGDAKYTTIIALCCMWVIRVIGGYIVGVVLGYGVFGVWAAMFTEWVIRSVLFYARLRGTKWHNHVVIRD